MKKIDSKMIALSAMSTAISIISLYLSFIINTLSITFMVIAAVSLMMLLSQGYVKSAVFCYIATSLLGGILIGFIPALSYILFFGLYTLISYIIALKVKSNLFKNILKALFYIAVIYPVVYISKILIGDTLLKFITKSIYHYIGFFVFAILVMFIYDYIMIKIFPVIKKYVSKAMGKHYSDNKNTAVNDNYGSNMYNKKDGSIDNVKKDDNNKDDDVFKF